MNWIEEVRKSLGRLRNQAFYLTRLYDIELGYAIGRSNVSSLKSAVEQADKALAAIPDEPEMMTFLKWLKSQSETDEGILYSLALSHEIGEYVWDVFGYKLPEEGDSGKENDSSPQA